MATSRGLSALAATLLALGLIGAGSAFAGMDEQLGADLLTAVERGEQECDDLDQADFEAVGEFVMGRMLGSPEAHEAMDRMMASMMSESGLDRMHEVMGIRFSGCGNPRPPGAFGGMMGAMGMMGGSGGGGMMGGGSAPGGMMGGFGPGAGDRAFPGQGFGPAGMMGLDRDDYDDVGAWVAVATLILVAGAVVAVLLFARPRRRTGDSAPLDLLAQRFARGEIGAEEFAERRRLLEEGAK